MPYPTCPDCNTRFEIEFRQSRNYEAVNREQEYLNVCQARCACKDRLRMDSYDEITNMATLQADFLALLAKLKPGERERDRAAQQAGYEASQLKGKP